MRLSSVQRGIFSGIPSLSFDENDDPEEIRAVIIRVCIYLTYLSKRKIPLYTTTSLIPPEAQIRSDLDNIVKGNNLQVSWLDRYPPNPNASVSMRRKNKSNVYDVYVSGTLIMRMELPDGGRLSIADLRDMVRASNKVLTRGFKYKKGEDEMVDEVVEVLKPSRGVLRPRAVRSVEINKPPAEKQARVLDDPFDVNETGAVLDDIEDSEEEPEEEPVEEITSSQQEIIDNLIAEGDKYKRIVDATCRVAGLPYNIVSYYFIQGYLVGCDKQNINLTGPNGADKCRRLYLIPFFIGFLVALLEKHSDDFRSNLSSIVCRFKMVIEDNQGNTREVTLQIDLNKIGFMRYARARTLQEFMEYWLIPTERTRENASRVYLSKNKNLMRHLNEFVKELGIDENFQYNSATDTNFTTLPYYSKCVDCKVEFKYKERNVVRGNTPRRRIQGGNRENVFWEEIYHDKTMLHKYRDCWPNMVFYKGEHGCMDRAITCTCQPWKSEPYICICNRVGRSDIAFEQLNEVVKQYPYLIIGITINSKETRKKTNIWRTFDVLAASPDFYLQDQPVVIFVNIPEWANGMCHCARWITPKSTFKHYERYEHVGKFNKLISLLCETDDYICPICFKVIPYVTRKVHYNAHKHGFTCESCGLCFDDEKVFSDHVDYHCKAPRYMAKIELCDELKGYNEKKDKNRVINVYADLESAIDENGEHINILAGWCADSDHVVHIENSLEDMLNNIVKLDSNEMRIYFHNGEGYDFHFVIRKLCLLPDKQVKNFEIVNDSSEKVRYFSVTYKKKRLHFRDTFAFVSESLEKWVNSSKKSGCPFACFKQNISEDKQKEILKKNPFPYNAIKSTADLNRPFTDMLAWFGRDDVDDIFCYKYSKDELKEIKVWLESIYLKFGWNTIGDYYKDYLRCDVSQLCDIFEFFAKAVQEEYSLDIHQYFGTPGLTWAAWLSRNKFKLDPITDPKAFDIINSSIRGGQTGAMTRFYDAEIEKDTFVCDLDCNALYATAMLRFKFPCHDWYRVKNSGEIDGNLTSLLEVIKKVHARGESGFVEVDMVVKDEERFYSYVPVASKRFLRGQYDYQAMAEYAALYHEKVSSMTFSGLTQVVGEHEHYCCHTKLLEWYLEHDAVEVTKFYDAVIGKDEPVFQEYVQHNLEQRKKFADDPIKKMLYKLLNNALYGKTYEDVTRRSNFQLKLKDDLPDSSKIYRKVEEFGNWVLYEEINEICSITKPIYLGAAITEYSKLWMYRFFYDQIRPRFPKSEVMYTDTDALTIKFSDCGFTNLRGLADALNRDGVQVIDTSNFKEVPSEPRHTEHNNEPGLFKSETGEGRIMKMVALRAKTYIMVCDDGTIKMSVKGCPMKEKSRLTFETFREVLMGEKEPYEIEYNAIRSEKHRVYSKVLSKIVLSADDRKRYICPDKIRTYPLFSHFHKEALGKVTIPSGIELTESP